MFWNKPQNYDEAREIMIQKHLIKRGVKDPRVLAAMRAVPRHLFVTPEHRSQAYDDNPLPIGHQQTISQPFIVAHMTMLLALPEDGRAQILEIGTGSGYQTAILSHLAGHVYTVERIPALAEMAQAVFEQLALRNVSVKVADGGYGWPDHAPYHAILSAAASPTVPPPLLDQLADGGTLVAPIGPRHEQYLVRIRRHGEQFERENLTRVAFVPFRGEHGWQD